MVVLFRALCAVSREELEQGEPRVYCLEELVECAWNNIGGGASMHLCVCVYVCVCVCECVCTAWKSWWSVCGTT